LTKDFVSNKTFLFITNNYGVFGGAERQALIFAKHIKEKISKNVCFVAFEDGEQFKNMINENNIDTYYFPFNHKLSKTRKAFQYYKLIRFLKPLKPDILIPYVAESNKIVAQIWKYTGASFAFWNQREEGRKLYGTSLEKKLIRNVSAIVSNSFEGKEALIRTYDLKDEDITVINNGIIPYKKQFEIRNWHHEFGIAKNRPLVSMIANITNRKDHETLLKAWSTVISECKAKKIELPFLVMAGRKGNTYDNLRLLAFDFKLSDHIIFTGELNPVQPLIQQSLFSVFSSNLEGCPNGVLECMEQGKAVIGTNISGVLQALGDTYKSNCLTKPNDSKDLAEKIIALYNNPILIKEIGCYNAERIRAKFSEEQMVNEHLNLIKKN